MLSLCMMDKLIAFTGLILYRLILTISRVEFANSNIRHFGLSN